MGFALVWAAWCSSAGMACGGGRGAAGEPHAALAETLAAQREFRILHRRWTTASDADRRRLLPSLEAFIARHPQDDRARVARIYLAWVLIQRGELRRARALVAETREGVAGSAQDFAVVAEAAILAREGKPDEALDRLAPLAGKIVDADERFMYGEQRVRAAVAARHMHDAVRFMLEWVAGAPPEDRQAVQDRVLGFLDGIPARAVEDTLAQLDEESERFGEGSTQAPARDWLRKSLRERLMRLAIEQGDADLARRLLDSGAPGVRRGDRGAELARLAAAGSVVPRVQGRQVGLVLSTGSAALRRRSADVAAGMARALGLPQSASNPEAVRLLTSDDGGSMDGIPSALARLAGDGAAILVAGLDSEGAERAARYADDAQIPVIVLAPPSTSAAKGDGFAFRIGAGTEDVMTLLRSALVGQGPVAQIGGGSSDAASCAATAALAGTARFPVQVWRKEHVASLVFAGDPGCTKDALREARAIGLTPNVGLGLESAHLYPDLASERPTWVAACGSFPLGAHPDSAPTSPTAEMSKWASERHRAPSWWAALGHDAAALGGVALADFALERVDEASAVAELHKAARAKLAGVTASLWTTTSRGFGGDRRLPRSITVVAGGAAGSK